MKFSEKLQKLRKENNLSQEQLADMLDVSRQSVSKWESGQTYPEMDKLIAMCKIFKCTLDDLTNDNISDINITNKQKNNITNIIDELLDIINRSLNMFNKMDSKSIIHFVFEMILLVVLLILFKIPFNWVYSLGNEIFRNFPITINNILSSIFNLVLTISYFILFIIIFVYIYKIRFLDKYDNMPLKEDNIDTKNYEDDNIEEEIKVEKKEISKPDRKDKKENSFVLFRVLGNIVMLFIRFASFCIGVPFIFSLVFLFASLIASIILIFKGVFFFGILIGIISCIMLNILIIELIFKFLFNGKVSVRKSFLTLIISLAGIGIGFGITAFDITNISYIDEVPTAFKEKTISKTIDMKDDLMIYNHGYNIKYVSDDSLENKVLIDVKYYDKYSRANIIDDSNHIFIVRENVDKIVLKDLINCFIEDLLNKEIHNYNYIYKTTIIVTASSENITKMINNRDEYYANINESERYYDNLTSDYERQINEKDNRILELEDENQNLQEKLDEYKNKIQEYKDNINSLIEE